VMALLNACFGNSFIDLSKYMNMPSKLSKALLEKYRVKVDEKESEHRNNLISNWLKYATVGEVKSYISNSPSIDDYSRAVAHLYSGNKTAVANILNFPMPHESNRLTQKENEQSVEIMKILSGDLDYNRNFSWKCNIGSVMWYDCKHKSAKAAYENLSKKFSNADPENSPFEYNDPLLWSILALYCNPEDVDIEFFRERGIDGQNSMVRRTMWITITALRQLNKHFSEQDGHKGDVRSQKARENFQNLIEEYYTKITYEFAFELETLGLWKWALFAVLHLENDYHKLRYVKETLLKHIHEESDHGFLVNDLQIPSHLIHEAEAIYFQGKGIYSKAFYQWLKGEFYQNAHNILINHMLISSESLPEKFNDLQTIMNKLDLHKDYITNWDTQGKVIFEFLELRNEAEKFFNTYFDKYGDFVAKKNNPRQENPTDRVNKLLDKLSQLIKAFEKF